MVAQPLYEELYCARGEMENRIKEQQLLLFAARTSTHAMRSNQLRVLFSTMAYVLHKALKEFGLKGTSMASAQVNTTRSKLLKIGGQITVSVRRMVLPLSQAYPYQDLFRQILSNLRLQELTPLRPQHAPRSESGDPSAFFPRKNRGRSAQWLGKIAPTG